MPVAAPRPNRAVAPTLTAEIAKLQQSAGQQQANFWELGVFLFFSTAAGDAWLLEVTENDAVQVASAGAAVALHVEENAQTIVINWSHTFALRDRRLILTSYEDRGELILDQAPTQQIHAAIRRIRKRYDQALLDQVHLVEDTEQT